MKGKERHWSLAWTRTWGERIAGERPYGQIYAKRLWRWEGGAHSSQRACASETFPGLRTLGQDLERGMRGLSGWALA